MDGEALATELAELARVHDDALRERHGDDGIALIARARRAAHDLRAGALPGGRDAFAAVFAALDATGLDLVVRATAQAFHLMNLAEERQRLRVLAARERDGSARETVVAAVEELAAGGVPAAELRDLLGRLLVMPVLTAHPTEARRQTVLDHLAGVAGALDQGDDRALREAVLALHVTEEARAARPSPLDEVRAGLHVFERTLFDVVPLVYRDLEAALARGYPGERFDAGPFLRFGTWIGGDRDGHPQVTAEVTRSAFERQRSLALARHAQDAAALGRLLSVSARRAPGAGLARLEASLRDDRARMPEVAARARRHAGVEPWREKMWFVQARLAAARARSDGGYPDAAAYLADLRLVEDTLAEAGLAALAAGRVRDARRRAEVFGFHVASLDLRQHSAAHADAVAELLAAGGAAGYHELDERARQARLVGLLERAVVPVPRARAALSPATREVLDTLEVAGRARRELGTEACERYVVSFTSAPSDLLEVVFLARAAGLAPGELRPVPLFEQAEDLARAGQVCERLCELRPAREALGGELEVMIGYSDSGKQMGYVAAAAAVWRAQAQVARVAAEQGVTLTVFHGRGGAIGRGGGPANRTIRAQPPGAVRGRLRMTEQGETVDKRYGNPGIARRDLGQMIHAVLTAHLAERAPPAAREWTAREAALDAAAVAARAAYDRLVGDRERLARYAVAVTPILELAEIPIASRPASRRAPLTTTIAFDDLRAIPWVFSWVQSRHGIPGWYGLGAAIAAVGVDQARRWYASWPFFHALVDNARLALARTDIDVAAQHARLAGPDGAQVFAEIRREHDATVAGVLTVIEHPRVLDGWPALAAAVQRRNPHVDLLSHAQIELRRRLAANGLGEVERARLRETLHSAINGIAAGLQTVG